MKYLLALLIATAAYAETAPAVLNMPKIAANRRAVLRNYPFIIYFPWRTCRTNYRAHVRYPSVIQGVACGTRVRCVLRYGNRYACRY